MAQDKKRRRIVSYENMSADIAEAFAEKFPNGLGELAPEKYTKPDGTPFYAVEVETADSICLVKIPVQVDDPDELQRWLEGEEEAEIEKETGSVSSSEEGDNTLPDDNIAQYGSDDDSSDPSVGE